MLVKNDHMEHNEMVVAFACVSNVFESASTVAGLCC